MSLDRVDAGRDLANDFNVIIEIPMHADPIKYEVDKETGALFVDRFVSTSMHYPCNYGYIPKTLAGDGDPVDVLVITPFALMPGVVVRCRPIGLLKLQDEEGEDTKLLAVPIDKLTPLYRHVETARDLPELVLTQITHFFQHYKDLEPGKWVKIEGWGAPEEARRAIAESVRRAKAPAARKKK
jgi:inorganic pyrophosphatase